MSNKSKIFYFVSILLTFLMLADMTNIVTAIMIIISIFLYFLPTIIGEKKENSTSILLLNLFLGWTLIGWVVAIIWATSKDTKNTLIVEKTNTTKTKTEQIKELKELLDDGTINEIEFEEEKRNILRS